MRRSESVPVKMHVCSWDNMTICCMYVCFLSRGHASVIRSGITSRNSNIRSDVISLRVSHSDEGSRACDRGHDF